MKKNYKLQRTLTAFALVTSLSLATSTLYESKLPNKIPYTDNDLITNIQFSKELAEITTENVEFSNTELKSIIEEKIDGPITEESLQSITILSITKHLNNKDLSELKYLTNLNGILIYNNDVDLSDLKYNQYLQSIILNSCTIENTQDLPNSIVDIKFEKCICNDKEVILPYYTREFTSNSSIANNLKLKNPSSLEKLSLYTDCVLDIKNLKDCTNLKELSLLRLTNVKNPQYLESLTNLESLNIDEYAITWLDNETLTKLPVEKSLKKTLSSLIEKVDSISESIISNPNSTPEEKASQIVLYLLDNFEYDHDSIDNYEIDSSGITEYNDNPISTFLDTNIGVCVNYTCLFSAIANRVGIETFELYTNDHMWNSIKTDDGYSCYDLSYLEVGAIVKIMDKDSLAMIQDTSSQDLIRDNKGKHLVYYEFDIDEIVDSYHNAFYTPEEIIDNVLNIGYINEDCSAYIIEQSQKTIKKMDIFTKSFIILSIITIFTMEMLDRKQKDNLLDNEIHYNK